MINNPVEYTKAVLALFKKIPVVTCADIAVDSESSKLLITEDFSERSSTINYGFVYTDTVRENNPFVQTEAIHHFIVDKYGMNIDNMNQGFMKSFETIINADKKSLMLDQICNYISTYGLESLGITDTAGYSYVPATFFNLPENDKPFVIMVIDLITNDDLKIRINNLVHAKAALDSETIDNIVVILKSNSDFDFSNEIHALHNKELKSILYNLYKKVPSNPIDFLRFVVYKKTGCSLLIKNHKLCNSIKNSVAPTEHYFRLADLKKLAEAFYRYKPLWLSFKHESDYMKYVINQIRRLAVKYHKPVPFKIIDHLTSSDDVDIQAFKQELSKVSVFKKISALNAILYRMNNPEAITYYIRNGLAFADDYVKKVKNFNLVIFNTLFNSIVDIVKVNVADKIIYLPDTIEYVVPTSTKLFWNNIPYGSSISLNKDIVVGVHWMNSRDKSNIERRIDLDLHINSETLNMGWHSRFSDVNDLLRTGKSIVFTGDMTDAPISSGGATEAYYISGSIKDKLLMVNLNYYNHNASLPVNYEFIIDNVNTDILTRDYLISAHTVQFNLPNVIDKSSEFLGILNCDEEGNKKFYFVSSSVSNKIVSKYTSVTEKVIKSIHHSCDTSLKLKTLLVAAGAKVVNTLTDEDGLPIPIDIDLSPINVTKDELLSIFAE